jgi:hypothetical protein
MNERERLIEMLADVGLCHYDTIADHLIANGVIVPPCKVGDTVYRTQGNYCGEKIFEGVVDQIAIFNNREIRIWVYGHPLGFGCDDIGKTVFLTKEEAEKALAEREQK